MENIFITFGNFLFTSFVIVVLISIAKNILMHRGRCMSKSPIAHFFNKKRWQLVFTTLVTMLSFYIFSYWLENMFMTLEERRTFGIALLILGFTGSFIGLCLTVYISLQIIFVKKISILKDAIQEIPPTQ